MAADTGSLRAARRNATPADGAIDEIYLVGSPQTGSRVIPAGQAVYLRGWVIDGQAMVPAARVTIVIDGTLEVAATYGLAREDIATFYGEPRLIHCGFNAVIPTGLGVGDHQVAVRAVGQGERVFSSAGTEVHVIPSVFPQRFSAKVRPGGIGDASRIATDGDLRSVEQRAGRFELLLGAGVEVDGWGFDLASRRCFLEIGALVDGCWYLRGAPGRRSRVDVALAHGLLDVIECGFVIRFLLNFLDPGDHELQVVGRDPDGSWVAIGKPFPFEAIEPALPWIWALPELRQPTRLAIDDVRVHVVEDEDDEPAAPSARRASPLLVRQGHGIFLCGWAVDAPVCGPASAVYIGIDGNRRDPIPARYGRARPAPPPIFGPGVWNDCGFTALVPTDDLAPGPHVLEPLVVARNGFGYYAPSESVTVEILAPEDESDDDEPAQSRP